ncbi:hypothetical protein WJX74_008586 [Apatococcus lobatus]|uniref:Uncharacterized protein n=1 Tax=Apatococcus lobatus TaxID=904363 RepID=A0AAW1SBK8_9CHLO
MVEQGRLCSQQKTCPVWVDGPLRHRRYPLPTSRLADGSRYMQAIQRDIRDLLRGIEGISDCHSMMDHSFDELQRSQIFDAILVAREHSNGTNRSA